jgi:hypothetical protein
MREVFNIVVFIASMSFAVICVIGLSFALAILFNLS